MGIFLEGAGNPLHDCRGSDWGDSNEYGLSNNE